MIYFFKRAPIAEFAQDLVNTLEKRYSPSLDQQIGKKPSVNRLTRIVEETMNSAIGFIHKNKLGWIGKSRLANEFRWALTEAGYTKEFVDFATEAMVVYLNKKTKVDS